MPAKTAAAPPRNVTVELAFLTRALKAPSLAAAIERLAERARTESWSHEEFLAACLQREVAQLSAVGIEASRPITQRSQVQVLSPLRI
jgi:hypothetical protein